MPVLANARQTCHHGEAHGDCTRQPHSPGIERQVEVASGPDPCALLATTLNRYVVPSANAVNSALVVRVTTVTSAVAAATPPSSWQRSAVTAYESTGGTSYSGACHVTTAAVAWRVVVAVTDRTGPGMKAHELDTAESAVREACAGLRTARCAAHLVLRGGSCGFRSHLSDRAGS